MAAPSTDDQVDHIIRMMLRGEWKGMKSRAELSEKWGIHEHTVGLRAQAASTFLRKQGSDIEVEAREALAELDTIKRIAMESVDKDGNPLLREATAAIKLKMDILGITTRRSDRNARQKPDVDDEYGSMPRQERIARLEAALAEERSASKEELQ